MCPKKPPFRVTPFSRQMLFLGGPPNPGGVQRRFFLHLTRGSGGLLNRQNFFFFSPNPFGWGEKGGKPRLGAGEFWGNLWGWGRLPPLDTIMGVFIEATGVGVPGITGNHRGGPGGNEASTFPRGPLNQRASYFYFYGFPPGAGFPLLSPPPF